MHGTSNTSVSHGAPAKVCALSFKNCEFGKDGDKKKKLNMEQYKVVTRIGEGAHGVVLLAKHLITGANVALKKVTVRAAAEGLPNTTLREVQVPYRGHAYWFYGPPFLRVQLGP